MPFPSAGKPPSRRLPRQAEPMPCAFVWRWKSDCCDAAVKCFDEAVGLSPDLVEAYRDRGLAYLALARCEAILAVDRRGRSGIA